MSCELLRSRMQDLIDGELSADQTAAAAAHLESCEPCQGRAEHLRRLKGRIAEEGGPEPAPRGLGERICREVRREAGGRSWIGSLLRRRITWAAAAVLAVALSAIGMGLLGSEGRPEIIGALVSDHVRLSAEAAEWEIPGQDTERLRRILGSHIGAALRLPKFLKDGPSLLGGRRCRVAGRNAALIAYEWRGERISLFVLQEEGLGTAAMEAGEVTSCRHEGLTLACWVESGLAYFFVGAESCSDLARRRA